MATSDDRSVVLLVEENPHLRHLLASELRRRQYAVVEASSGVQIIEYVVQSLVYAAGYKPPSLVISDIRLDNGDGLSIAEAMRVAKYDVPILLMTEFPEPEIELCTARIKRCKLMAKPFDLFIFLETAREMIDSVHRERAHFGPL